MRFVVDPPELHKASQKFDALSKEYTSVQNRLINTASTMGDAWKSADNMAFVEQINGFCEELKAMTTHLEQASLALAQQAKNYETTRENNITEVKKLAN
jgi:WXG100 family type VII secretion target